MERTRQRLAIVRAVAAVILAGALVMSGAVGVARGATTITGAFPSFTSTNIGVFQLNGSAVLSGSAVRLTPASAAQVGSLFWKNKISLRDNRSFSAYFEISMDSPDSAGADGVVFVVQSQTSSPSSSGGGIGYSGITPSVAVEFDTYCNDSGTENYDPAGDANHVALLYNGSPRYVQYFDPTWTLQTSDTYAWVDYDGINKKIYVRASNSTTRPASANITADIDLGNGSYIPQDVYVGFTAATGGSYENQWVRSFYINNDYIAAGITPGTVTYEMGPTSVTASASPTAVNHGGTGSVITARALNADGTGHAGWPISFTVVAGAGVLSNVTTLTDANGYATATVTSSSVGSVTVRATADGGAYGEATVSFTNTLPIAVGQSLSLNEDTPLGITLSGTDADGDSISYAVTVTPSHGTLSGSVPNITYTPALNYPSGHTDATDSFTFTVKDALGGISSSATINLTIHAINDPPVITQGSSWSVTMTEDSTPTPFSLTLNATDADGDTITWSIATQASHGTATVSGTGASKAISYVPSADYNGGDSFVVQVNDGYGGTVSITVNVTISTVNDAPSFTKGANQTVLEDCGLQTVTTWATAISAGPANESTQTLDFIVTNNNNALFSVQPAVSSTGALTYTPAANANGSATVTVQIHDNGGTANGGVDTSASQTFTITVTPVNDPPVNTAPPLISGIPHVGRTLTTTDGVWNDLIDTGVSGSSVLSYSYQWQRSTDGGTTFVDITGATGSTYQLTLADNLQLVRSKVMCTDSGVGDPATQTTPAQSTSVGILNAAPVISEGASVSAVCDEDESPAAFTYVLHATDTDAIDTLTWHIMTPPAHGTLTLPVPSAGTSTVLSFYHPAPNWNGVDTFVLQVADGLTGVDEVTVTVTVNPRNDPPVNVAPPSVDGHFWVGEQVTGNAGQWNDSIDLHPGNLTLSYQWERARDAVGTDRQAIVGATGPTYRIRGEDEGWFLRLVVTCTDDGEQPPNSMSTSMATVWTKTIYNDRQAPAITIADLGSLSGVSDYVAKAGTGPNDDQGEYWLTVRQTLLPLPFVVQDDRADGVTWVVTRNKQLLASGVGLGTWNAVVSLFEGSNDLTVSATDAAGNTTRQLLHILCDTQAPVIDFPNGVPASVSSAAFTLAGTVHDATTGVRSLTIDGENVVSFSDGSFSAAITLKSGKNAITIETIDRLGNARTQTVAIVYAPRPATVFTHTIQVTIDSKTMTVDGMKVALDAPARIVQSRTLVPLRVLVEQLGGTISWNAKTRQVTLKARGVTMVLTIGKSTALVNGKATAIDASNSKVVPLLISDRTMLPLRFVAENLGLQVDWNATTRMISLSWHD